MAARVVANDPANGLSLLQADLRDQPYLTFKGGMPVEEVCGTLHVADGGEFTGVKFKQFDIAVQPAPGGDVRFVEVSDEPMASCTATMACSRLGGVPCVASYCAHQRRITGPRSSFASPSATASISLGVPPHGALGESGAWRCPSASEASWKLVAASADR